VARTDDPKRPDRTDASASQLWHDVVAGAARTQRVLDQDIEATGVPAQWVPVLDLLLRADDHRLPMSTLARELAMTSGGFSKLADRMALDGVIDRRGASDDRRVVNATLTEKGLLLARTVHTAYQDSLRARVLSVVSGAELSAAAATMRALVAAHDDQRENAEQVVANERDPALPDRRGRGRSGSE
jgi:DNA-binding MarR family transcriptional regulator